MKKLSKILTLSLLTGMLAVSMSANAAGHKCKQGLKWDAAKKMCVHAAKKKAD